jgi:glyoxylase-like metal-dependent hydrolase (beta-lactamase superfamily II)
VRVMSTPCHTSGHVLYYMKVKGKDIIQNYWSVTELKP